MRKLFIMKSIIRHNTIEKLYIYIEYRCNNIKDKQRYQFLSYALCHVLPAQVMNYMSQFSVAYRGKIITTIK